MPIHVGHSEYLDFDAMLRRLIGSPSLSTGLGQTLFAGGKGYDVPHMFVSSVSESVERVLGSLAIFDREILYATYRDMTRRGYACLGPGDIPLFAPEQYASGDLLYEPFTEESFVGWLEGRRLLGGERVWMPAQLVALFYPYRADEALIGYSTSGGLASHINERRALFHAITELIERDAVNLRWVSRMAPERIDLDRPPRLPALARLMDAGEGLPGEFHFYLHSTDIPAVPVVTVMQVCPWLQRWSYYAGGGVNLDIDLAMLQALTEFGQSERTLRLASAAPERGFAYGVRRMFDIEPDTPLSRIDIFFKIIAYYGYPQNARKMDWYLHGPGRVALSSLPSDRCTEDEAYERLLDVLRQHSIDPVVFDFSPPQLRQVRLMKAYVTELAPPYLHSKPLLGHPRYYELPKRLGFSPGQLEFADLLTDPMPYP
jgi:ribosomal protein S12 methylthiotransferase accessory factor